MAKKIIVAIILVLVFFGLIRSCVSRDEQETTTTEAIITTTEFVTETTSKNASANIKSIEFSDEDALDLEIGDEEYSYIRVVYEDDFDDSDIIFVSSDESVATITLNRRSRSLVYFDIKAVGEGIATVCAQTVDGSVRTANLIVSVSSEETTTQKETVTKEETATAKNVAVAESKISKETTKKITTTKEESNGKKDPAKNNEYVLNTNTKKIHYGSCSSVEDIKPENYSKTTDYDKAIAQGYVPCKRCNP